MDERPDGVREPAKALRVRRPGQVADEQEDAVAGTLVPGQRLVLP